MIPKNIKSILWNTKYNLLKKKYSQVQPFLLQVKKPLQLKHNVAGWMEAIHSFQLVALSLISNIKLLFSQEVGIAHTHTASNTSKTVWYYIIWTLLQGWPIVIRQGVQDYLHHVYRRSPWSLFLYMMSHCSNTFLYID